MACGRSRPTSGLTLTLTLTLTRTLTLTLTLTLALTLTLTLTSWYPSPIDPSAATALHSEPPYPQTADQGVITSQPTYAQVADPGVIAAPLPPNVASGTPTVSPMGRSDP